MTNDDQNSLWELKKRKENVLSFPVLITFSQMSILRGLEKVEARNNQ